MNILEEFQQFRGIFCICPCCQRIVRVSDLKLKVKGKALKTWLDEYDMKNNQLAKKEERFGEIEKKLREKHKELGRRESEKQFNNAIQPEFKALKLNPFDIKPLLNPVDFVVFNGMEQNEKINNIIFLSKQTTNNILNKLRQQTKEAIQKKKYEWQLARIDKDFKITYE